MLCIALKYQDLGHRKVVRGESVPEALEWRNLRVWVESKHVRVFDDPSAPTLDAAHKLEADYLEARALLDVALESKVFPDKVFTDWLALAVDEMARHGLEPEAKLLVRTAALADAASPDSGRAAPMLSPPPESAPVDPPAMASPRAAEVSPSPSDRPSHASTAPRGLQCPQCERVCTSENGLMMHTRAKHK